MKKKILNLMKNKFFETPKDKVEEFKYYLELTDQLDVIEKFIKIMEEDADSADAEGYIDYFLEHLTVWLDDQDINTLY